VNDANGQDRDLPRVSVVIPIRNEASFIGRCLRSVLDQDYPADRMEVLVVDGMSTDGTRTVVQALLRQRVDDAPPAVRVLDNPAEIVPAAMNLALADATGDVIVRVDGHAVLHPDYVRRCVDVLRTTGSACVGGVVETVGTGAVGRAISAAQSSRFGVGGVAFRTGRHRPGPVDTVAFGAYPRAVLAQVGGYDEELACNEDDELNFRLQQAGEQIWYDPSIRAQYFSRATLGRLWRQYYRYGLYKVLVARKRGGFASPRHLVPAAFVAATAASSLVAAARRDARWTLPVLAPYAAALVAASYRSAQRTGTRPGLVGIAFVTLHVAYGSGFLAGLERWRRPPHTDQDGTSRTDSCHTERLPHSSPSSTPTTSG
jgi:cellulose synthase/poly-beta-1,6-N-acetylglucosamine synthase-like glycosyltransferase